MTRPPALPLCSVGIPTYNRPDLLSATIAEIRSQSYRELEITISDNASPDPQVERIGREAAAADPRIRYFRQPENRGARANFEYVLCQSTGKYFMWAADDDRRVDTYIERLVAELESRTSAALCGMESRYMTEKGEAPYFPQSETTYCGLSSSRIDRVIAMLTGLGVANLMYGVFRRAALFHDGMPVTSVIGPTMNEHPLFALVADKGDVVCLPEVGLFKLTSEEAFRHAKWEVAGGFLHRRRRIGMPPLRYHRQVFRYHRDVFAELDRTYQMMDMSGHEIARVRRAARRQLRHHAIQMALGWKPPPRMQPREGQVGGETA